jgi:hypothetical protein
LSEIKEIEYRGWIIRYVPAEPVPELRYKVVAPPAGWVVATFPTLEQAKWFIDYAFSIMLPPTILGYTEEVRPQPIIPGVEMDVFVYYICPFHGERYALYRTATGFICTYCREERFCVKTVKTVPMPTPPPVVAPPPPVVPEWVPAAIIVGLMGVGALVAFASKALKKRS